MNSSTCDCRPEAVRLRAIKVILGATAMHPSSFLSLLLVTISAMCMPPKATAGDPAYEDLIVSSGHVPMRRHVCEDAWCWVTADAIFLSHSGSDFRSEILDPGSGSVTISQDLEHGFPVAPRIQVATRLYGCWHAQLVYFGTDAWDSTARIRDVPPMPDLSADINYEAELQNVELNFLQGPSFIDTFWLVGLRYLKYQDSFMEAYRLDPALGPSIAETAIGEADNSLFGPQIGLFQDVGNRITELRMGGKLGFMNNRIKQFGPAYDNAITIDGVPEIRFDNEIDEFAFLGEVSLTLSHHFTRHLSLRVGYQGVYLDSIAQSATQNGQPATDRNLWIHGALLGAQCRW